MAEDSDTPAPQQAQPAIAETASTNGHDEDAKYAQAIRFLVSLQSQQNQDQEAQRAFLLSKGLDEATIERAMREAKRPQVTQGLLNDGTQSHATSATAGLPDAEAFDTAAKMFDDPLHSDALAALDSMTAPSPPPKTYPRSPLALYQQQPSSQAQQYAQSTIDNPLTRYHVLLRFFRSLSYFLMLGGGIAAVLVGVYRSYMLPRIVSTLDSRSQLLKHHRDLYIMLANRINDVRHNGLATLAPAKEGDTSASRKSAVKKVQFADEVGVSAEVRNSEVRDANSDDEGKKQSGEKQSMEKSAQPVTEKTPLLDGHDPSPSSDNPDAEQQEAKEEEVEPIDILQPLRASLLRLHDTLRADTSAAAIGTDFAASPKPALATSSSPANNTTVQDESDADSWLSESDSDELEFDPYAAPPSKSRGSAASAARRKHTPKTGALSSRDRVTDTRAAKSASETSAATLKSALGTMNAYINSQTFRARIGGAPGYGSASSYGNGAAFGTLGGIGSPTTGGAENGKDEAGKANAARHGDVAQIRADIRSLKGLLLSRRNFPIYGRPNSGHAARAETAA